MRTGDQARSLGEITVGRGTGRGGGDLVTVVFPWAFQYAEMIFLLLKLGLVDPEGVVIAGKKGVVLN